MLNCPFAANGHQTQFILALANQGGQFVRGENGLAVRRIERGLVEDPSLDFEFLLGLVDVAQGAVTGYDCADPLANLSALLHVGPIDRRAVTQESLA